MLSLQGVSPISLKPGWRLSAVLPLPTYAPASSPAFLLLLESEQREPDTSAQQRPNGRAVSLQPAVEKGSSREPGCRHKVFSESSGGKLLSLVLYRALHTAPAKCFGSCDKGAQPYAARGKAGNYVTKVVHPKVHPAEADEEHQQRCPKDDCRPSPPGS